MRPELWLVDHAPIMGGAEQLVVKLARHARRRGDVRVVVVCPPGGQLARVAGDAGVELETLPMAHFAGAGAPLIGVTLARLAALLRAAGQDAAIVACSSWSQALVAACAPLLRGRPILHMLVEQQTAERALARAVLGRIGVPVALGENTTRTYERALRRDDVVTFHNVLGDDELRAAAAAPRRAASPAARPSDAAPDVGVIARFIADKGLVELVDELAASPAHWGAAHLAGDAQDTAYVERVRRRIAHHGLEDRIRVSGRIDDVRTFFDDADVAVVPSTGSEGQPTVILEALARGCGVVVRAPIYARDYAGLPVEPYTDARDLGDALQRAARPPVALERLAERFGADQALDALLYAARTPGALRRRR